MVYKDKRVKPTKFSKTFAKANLLKVVDELTKDNKVVIHTEGRKKLYALTKTQLEPEEGE